MKDTWPGMEFLFIGLISLFLLVCFGFYFVVVIKKFAIQVFFL
jgi:hypothetical protein